MKKLVSTLFALLALLSVTGCAAVRFEESSASSSSVVKQSEQTVQLIVQSADGQPKEQTVTFEEGDSVLEILDAAYDIEETNGFITAIDGLKQDESKKTYWMYKVNGEVADKGAGELEPKAGDKIEFYQEKF